MGSLQHTQARMPARHATHIRFGDALKEGFKQVALPVLFPPAALLVTYFFILPFFVVRAASPNTDIVGEVLASLLGASFCFSLTELCLEKCVEFARFCRRHRHENGLIWSTAVCVVALALGTLMTYLAGVYALSMTMVDPQTEGQSPVTLAVNVTISFVAIVATAFTMGLYQLEFANLKCGGR